MSLAVVRVAGLATVQDGGRRGHMHEAVPPGGALVRALLAAANRAAGNADDAPGIEVLGRLVVRAAADVVVATDDAGVRALHAGDELVIASGARRCTYLALRGGVAAPRVLDGRGTLLCAELGAPLRAGDAIAPDADGAARVDAVLAGGARGPRIAPRAALDLAAPVRVVPGPDGDAFAPGALAVLASVAYRVLPSSDRVGTRLAGPRLPRVDGYRERSRPMVRGAIEVPLDGQPIVLGPEHPTTGGYPVIGVVAAADLDRLFATPLGGAVRFTA